MKKNSKDFLLEINVEELPVTYVNPALKEAEEAFLKELSALHVNCGEIYTAATATVLICYIKDVALRQEEVSKEILGPPKRIAFDESGKLTKQGIGFAKKLGIEPEDLKVKETPKGEYVVVEKKEEPQNTKEILLKIIPKIIKNIHFPKTMKWDSSGLRFARPIQSILALFGEDLLHIELGEVSQKRIKPISPLKYLKAASKKSLLDPIKRKQFIRSSIFKTAKKFKLDQTINEELLEEINFMVTSPKIFVGEFDKKFLDLPEDVLKASMSKYQRVFPVFRKKRLLNKFIAVIDGAGKDIKSIRKNYEKILEARLQDSLFFFKEDTKKSFSESIPQLKDLIFHKDLGNMFEKIKRLQELCSFICKELKLKDILEKDIKRAAELSKIDLVTRMVGEFPSLQGTMGKEYALKSGEKSEVSLAIEEHYLPRNVDSDVPKSLAGAVLAVSDRVDNITGFLGMGAQISGSFDPFAIRRNTQGLVQIIKKHSLRLNMDDLIQKSIDLYSDKLSVSGKELKNKVITYIKERIEFLIGSVKPIELKKAALSVSKLDVSDAFRRIKLLSSIANERYFLEAAKVVERTSNILKGAKKETVGKVNEKIFEEDLERKVWKIYLDKKNTIQDLINKEEYKEATKQYGQAFFRTLHDFFDNVLVNIEDRSLRLNRLAIMKAINILYTEEVADLSKLPQIVVK